MSRRLWALFPSEFARRARASSGCWRPTERPTPTAAHRHPDSPRTQIQNGSSRSSPCSDPSFLLLLLLLLQLPPPLVPSSPAPRVTLFLPLWLVSNPLFLHYSPPVAPSPAFLTSGSASLTAGPVRCSLLFVCVAWVCVPSLCPVIVCKSYSRSLPSWSRDRLDEGGPV